MNYSELNWISGLDTGAINFRPCAINLWAKNKKVPVWRSGSLLKLNAEQIAAVTNQLGITKWYCLNEISERVDFELALSSKIEKVSISLRENTQFRKIDLPQVCDYIDLYWHYLTTSSDAIANLFNNLGQINHHQTILISCYAGKDRTGLISALLNGLLTTDYQLIIDDYTLSAIYMVNQIEFFQGNWEKRNITQAEYLQRFQNMQKIITEILSRIDNQYGGIPAYCHAIGVSEASIENIRSFLNPYLQKN